MAEFRAQTSNGNRVYDLEERTALFGEQVIDFVKCIGANYMEADGAESKKDFKHKIAICKKEARENKHWLRMLLKTNPDRAVECKRLSKEVHELTLIFSSILLSKKK